MKTSYAVQFSNYGVELPMNMDIETALSIVDDNLPDGAYFAMLCDLTGLDQGVISKALMERAERMHAAWCKVAEMIIPVGVLVNLDCEPIHWHLPKSYAEALPTNQELWEALWKHREEVLGFAYSHPGSGKPEPSHEDLTTFAAIESSLGGKRLVWWITSEDEFIELCWIGPGEHDYGKGPAMYEPEWMSELRTLSNIRRNESWAK